MMDKDTGAFSQIDAFGKTMDSYADYLLEFIAWRAAAGNHEFKDFRIWIRGEYNAFSVSSAKTILRDVPARPAARAGAVPDDELGQDGGVRIDTGKGAPEAKKRSWLPKKQNDRID